MKTNIPIYKSLVISISILVLIVAVLLLVVSQVSNRQQANALASTAVEQALAQTYTETRRLFAPIKRSVITIGQWIKSDALQPDDWKATFQLLRPILNHHPQITAILIADHQGNEVKLSLSEIKDGRKHYVIRLLNSKHSNNATEIVFDTSGEIKRQRSRIEYDPRSRPWYQGANASSTISENSATLFWTAPYRFYTNQQLGMTASLAINTSDKSYVVAIDMTLKKITRFTQHLNVTRNSMAMVVTQDRKIIGLPRGIELDTILKDNANTLIDITHVSAPIISNALLEFYHLEKRTGEAFPFSHQHERWWAAARRYRLSADNRIWISVALPESDMLGNTQQIVYVVIGLLILLGIIASFIIKRIAIHFSQPLELLAKDSYRISHGNFDVNTTVNSRIREIQALSQAHQSMREGLQHLLKMEKDMQIAQQIQKACLPETLPSVPSLEISVWGQAADETGGDIYDVIGLRQSLDPDKPCTISTQSVERILFMLADASGHGIGSALSVMQARAMLRTAIASGLALCDAFGVLNQQLLEDMSHGRFITLWLGLYDTTQHQLHSFSAGQGPMLHYRAQKQSIDTYQADAPPLGIVPQSTYSQPAPINLDVGDLFVVLSDGIYEAKNSHEERFGQDRVEAILRTHYPLTASEIMEKLLSEVKQYCGDTPADDDRTAIIIKRIKSQKNVRRLS